MRGQAAQNEGQAGRFLRVNECDAGRRRISVRIQKCRVVAYFCDRYLAQKGGLYRTVRTVPYNVL
jgi:hypothetical protein